MTSVISSELISVEQCRSPSVDTLSSLVTLLVQTLYVGKCSISRPEYWPPDYAETALTNGLNTYDYVIVGAGSAGSVVASRLSEDSNLSVLVLEAGGDPPEESEIPNFYYNIQHTNFTFSYFVERNEQSCKAYRNEQCYWPSGKIIGGTGAINAMLYVRGHRGDYDRWYREGNTGWSYDEVLPYYEKSIRPVGNETHPQGYMTIDEFNHFDEDIFSMIFEGGRELGIPTIDEFKEGSNIGYAHVKGTLQNGLRSSTGKSHLGRVRDRSNLHVIKFAEAEKIIFNATNERVTGVQFSLRDQTFEVQIRNELILSAGTINTVKLLMQSGVGPAEVLNNANIPVLHDLPVGKNLQDHVMIQLPIKLTGKIFIERSRLDETYQLLMDNSGPLTAHGTLSLTGFINTQPERISRRPDIEFHHLTARRGDRLRIDTIMNSLNYKDEIQSFLRSINDDYDILIVYILLAHPRSVGDIKITSASPDNIPIINAGYMTDPDDVEVLLRSLTYIRNLVNTTSFRERQAEIIHIPIEECDEYEFLSEGYNRCYLTYFSATMYHQTGTVKMGADDDDTACVNTRLQLKGVDNLRVADASIMPYVTSGNTNAPTVMIAERAADFIKEDLITN